MAVQMNASTMENEMEMRSELKNFAVLQETVLRKHDDVKGAGWKHNDAQALASRLVEELGEVITHLFGRDPVCDFLIASLQDHVEECAVSLDYQPVTLRTELADVANFCMMLHDNADKIDPRAVADQTVRA